MKTLRGAAASPGTAVGAAYLYQPDVYAIPQASGKAAAQDLDDLARALASVAASLDAAADAARGDARDILRAQAAIARDPALRTAAEPAVRDGMHPARAILDAGEQFAHTLEQSGNSYLAGRAPDVRHICDLAARALAGAPPRMPPEPREPCVLVAADLMPSDTATLDPRLVLGIVTARGTRTSHTAVIARALGVPAVVGVRAVLDEVSGGVVVGLDGSTGDVVIAPDAGALARLDAAGNQYRERRSALRSAAGSGPARTADGVHVEVAANVSGVEEVRAALAEFAEGVGLFRTELLYLNRDRPPTEEEHVEVLRAMRALLGPQRRLVVRTLDIGADKPVPFLPVRPERNPELGVRGLRLSRLHPDLLDTQLRAVAAVASLGPTAVMAPMVATVEEVRWFVERAAAAGVPPSVEIGVMVEVPALALQVRDVAPLVAFLSVGTNDLAQYLFAADRRNESLAPLQDSFSPALLRMVGEVCHGSAGRARVAVCGEAASDPAWALLAVGLGVSELSMQALAIPAVRAALRGVTLDACREAARRALGAPDAAAARVIGAALVQETMRDAA